MPDFQIVRAWLLPHGGENLLASFSRRTHADVALRPLRRTGCIGAAGDAHADGAGAVGTETPKAPRRPTDRRSPCHNICKMTFRTSLQVQLESLTLTGPSLRELPASCSRLTALRVLANPERRGGGAAAAAGAAGHLLLPPELSALTSLSRLAVCSHSVPLGLPGLTGLRDLSLGRLQVRGSCLAAIGFRFMLTRPAPTRPHTCSV